MIHTILFLLSLVFLLTGVYIAIAWFSKPKLWPFKKHNKSKDKQHSLSYADTDKIDSSNPSTGSSVVAVIIVIIFIIFFIVAMYFGIKMSMMRYKIAGEAIKQGNTGVALGALAPEIGEGVGDLAGGIGNAIRG